MSQRQAHGQTHRHSHAPTRRETAAGASSSARAIAPVRGQGQRNERMGGWLSGETEAERDEGSETHSKTVRGRYRQTDRDTCTQSHTHTHTHTGRQRQREGDRASDRETANGRQTGERGWHLTQDRHTGTDCEPPQREAARKKQLPQGRGRQPWVDPGWMARRGALGLAVTVGTPRLPRSRGLKGPLPLG